MPYLLDTNVISELRKAPNLPISESVIDRWGHLMAARTFPVIDGLLAATALTFDLTLATRNIDDFTGSGVNLVNPFEQPTLSG